jgi:predicted PurR-regulated permease PerM
VALNPAVDWLDRRGLPRVVAIVLVYLALLFLVVGITALLLPPLISQGQALGNLRHRPGPVERQLETSC